MDNFQWTDELVKEFEIFYNKIDYAITGCDPIQKGIDQFKKSKEPKKEYEILEFITPYLGENDVIFKRTMDGDFSVLLNGFGDIVSEMSLSSNPVVRIHSVRRLSDGQIFTVGDIIVEGIIISFHLTNIGMGVQCGNVGCLLNEVSKVNRCLFTTEDGVPVYEGDKVCLLSTSRWHLVKNVSSPVNPFYGDNHESFKYFSTEEAAKEYILMNKHLLSVNDIKDWLEKYFDYPNGINVNHVRELAKSKL
jgi:hypothetical protein